MMTMSTEQVKLLSETHLSQALGQIRQVPTFSGSTQELSAFIRRIEFILQLYPTTDTRQQHVCFSAIEMQLAGDAQRVSQLSGARTWPDLMNALISEYKTQTPCEELLRRLYNTPFAGSIRKFVEDLETKSFIISNKLMLENNVSNTILYTNAMNNTVKDVIMRKLPDRLFMTLARHDITTVSKLKQVAQQEGVYETVFNDKTKPQNNSNSNTNSPQNSKNKGNYQNFSNNAMHNAGKSNQNTHSKPAEANSQVMNEFKQKLSHGRAQNPLNHQQQNNSAPNPPVKRQRESTSGQYKMDTGENFLQPASESESDSEEEEARS